jgi:hypothetical protein
MSASGSIPADRGDPRCQTSIPSHGLRFVDEGVNYRNFTYAVYSKAILQQPGGIAFQIFDARVDSERWLRKEEYEDMG